MLASTMTPNPVTVEITIAIPADTDAPVSITVPSIAPEVAIAIRDAAIRAAPVHATVSGVVTIDKLRAFFVGP